MLDQKWMDGNNGTNAATVTAENQYMRTLLRDDDDDDDSENEW